MEQSCQINEIMLYLIALDSHQQQLASACSNIHARSCNHDHSSETHTLVANYDYISFVSTCIRMIMKWYLESMKAEKEEERHQYYS